MPASYQIVFLHPSGQVLRLISRECSDDREAEVWLTEHACSCGWPLELWCADRHLKTQEPSPEAAEDELAAAYARGLNSED